MNQQLELDLQVQSAREVLRAIPRATPLEVLKNLRPARSSGIKTLNELNGQIYFYLEYGRPFVLAFMGPPLSQKTTLMTQYEQFIKACQNRLNQEDPSFNSESLVYCNLWSDHVLRVGGGDKMEAFGKLDHAGYHQATQDSLAEVIGLLNTENLAAVLYEVSGVTAYRDNQGELVGKDRGYTSIEGLQRESLRRQTQNSSLPSDRQFEMLMVALPPNRFLLERYRPLREELLSINDVGRLKAVLAKYNIRAHVTEEDWEELLRRLKTIGATPDAVDNVHREMADAMYQLTREERIKFLDPKKIAKLREAFNDPQVQAETAIHGFYPFLSEAWGVEMFVATESALITGKQINFYVQGLLGLAQD